MPHPHDPAYNRDDEQKPGRPQRTAYEPRGSEGSAKSGKTFTDPASGEPETDGHASSMRAHVSGVGGVQFGGSADSLDASISGFGGIKVRQVKGQVRKSVSGGGHVTIGERT